MRNSPSLCGGYCLHLSLSSGENFQGAKLFSTLLNIAFHSCGALLSSITNERRSSRMISSGEMETGHSSTQALHVVHARSSSTVIELKRFFSSFLNSPFLSIFFPI